MMKRFATVAALALSIAWSGAARSQDTVRIGLIDDQSSVYSSLGGKGTILAVQMAIEDFGGRALDRPIEFKSADHLNQPDLGLSLANGWLDRENFSVILGGGSSAVLLAVQNAMKTRPTKTLMITGASSMDFAGKACTANSMHFGPNNYVLLGPTVQALTARGDNSWYILSSDNAGGKIALETATNLITGKGGSRTGFALFPLEATDFSSFLLQAQASRAKVLGLATSGSPLVALVKQSGEFGLQASGLKIALLAAFITDIHSLGLKDMQGLVFSSIFYWDRTDANRAWAERFFKAHGAMPTQMQAAAYTAVTHYLKGVQKAGTSDAQKVVPTMKDTRISDALFEDAYVRKDGMVIRPAYFVQVKTPAESKKPWDYYNILATIPGDEAYMSMKDQGCPLVQ